MERFIGLLQRVLLVCLLCSGCMSAAQVRIHGTVLDPGARPVPFCNVFLEREGLLNQLASTDEDGRFILQPRDTGAYLLVATSIGYKKHREEIHIGSSPLEITISLFPDTVVLGEVVVRGDSPIRIKGDTLVYDATYFARGDEVVLADLLKKLPGVTVEENGRVKFQGKEVVRIKIEDDDLFDNHYTILTRSLSADLVQDVEVLQQYSDNRLLKNIEDSDEVALNLKLKPGRKSQLFGDARAASNLRDRYDANINLASLLGNTKLYAISNANSIGEEPTGDAEAPSSSSRSAGGESSAGHLVPMAKPYLPEFKKDRYYFNHALFTSLAGIWRPTRKTKFSIKGYLFSDRSSFQTVNRMDYHTPSDTVRYEEQSQLENTELSGFLQATVEHDASNDLHIRYGLTLHSMSGDLNQESNFNHSDVKEGLVSSALRVDHLVTFTRRFTAASAVVLDLRYVNEKRPQHYGVDGNLLATYFSPLLVSDTLQQSSEWPMQSLGAELNYYSRVKHGKAGLRAGYVRLEQNIHSVLSSYPSLLSSNDLGLLEHKSYVDGYFAWQRGNVIITPKAALQHLDVSLSDRRTGPYLFLNPSLGLRWQLSRFHRIAALYAINRSTSSIAQLTRNPVLRDFNQLSINDDGFRVLPSRTLMAGYEFGNWGEGFSAFVTVFRKEADADYMLNTDIEPNYVVTTMNQVAEMKLSTAVVMFDKYFKSLRSNLKVNWNFSRTEFLLSTESVAVPTISNSHHAEVSLRSAFTGPINVHAGYSVHTSATRSGLIDASNYRSMVFVDAYVTAVASRFRLNVHGERFELTSVGGSPAFYFLDLSAWYSLRSQRVTLTMKGRNLLDESVYGQQFISSQTISASVNQLIPRYVMVGLELRF